MIVGEKQSVEIEVDLRSYSWIGLCQLQQYPVRACRRLNPAANPAVTWWDSWSLYAIMYSLSTRFLNKKREPRLLLPYLSDSRGGRGFQIQIQKLLCPRPYKYPVPSPFFFSFSPSCSLTLFTSIFLVPRFRFFSFFSLPPTHIFIYIHNERPYSCRRLRYSSSSSYSHHSQASCWVW